MSRTTPPPCLNVLELLPTLSTRAKTAVLLHPRIADVPVPADISKLGGRFLWPDADPWPSCPEHHQPLAPILQLRKSDVPEFPFKPDTDLFQLLWCPEYHAFPPIPHIHATWRTNLTVGSSHPQPPSIPWRTERDVKAAVAIAQSRGIRIPLDEVRTALIPPECLLFPERVQEFPDIQDLTPEEEQILDNTLLPYTPEFNDRRQLHGRLDAPTLYQSELSTSPGTKIGGHPLWHHTKSPPRCDHGHPMDLLFRLSDSEGTLQSWRRWMPLEDRPHWQECVARRSHAGAPWELGFGIHGDVMLFICQTCPAWPLKVRVEVD
ncbi:MAG: hypothetical protein ACTHN5_01765 [Phycisphaerae bacterium]